MSEASSTALGFRKLESSVAVRNEEVATGLRNSRPSEVTRTPAVDGGVGVLSWFWIGTRGGDPATFHGSEDLESSAALRGTVEIGECGSVGVSHSDG